MSYEFSCKRLRETEKAVQVVDYASGEEIWFPLSQVEEMHFHTKTHEGTIIVSDWIAKAKGLTS